MNIPSDHHHCPECGSQLADLTLNPPKGLRFDACIRKCEPCGVAFSNALRSPTRIYRDPLNNIPPEARPGALEALKSAINITSRPNKLCKFGFSTSEDALTWTVFSYLQQQGLLGGIVRSLALLPMPPNREPVLLLWGSPFPQDSVRGKVLHTELTTLLDQIGEYRRSYSEPDVILDFGESGLILIEVKYNSPNEISREAEKFSKYLRGTEAFQDPSRIIESGFYELARNWRIGFDWAESRPFALVNLVVASSDKSSGLRTFRQGIAKGASCSFEQVKWCDLLDHLTLPHWLTEYTQRLLPAGRVPHSCQPHRHGRGSASKSGNSCVLPEAIL